MSIYMDWKEMLGQLRNNPELPAGDEPTTDLDIREEKPKKSDKLRIFVEKKGRKGKTATIIEGFTCDEDELAEIAGQLKKKLGVGGSARGGEILIQGEVREKAIEILKGLGFRV